MYIDLTQVFDLTHVYISKNRRVGQKYTPTVPNINLTFVTEFSNVTDLVCTIP